MKTPPPWTVEYYQDGSGRNPVLEFLEHAAPGDFAASLRLIDLLKEFGTGLGPPYCKHVEGDLWELRPRSIRLFYFAGAGRRFVIVHAYHKKRQKAPRREIRVAMARMKELRGQSNESANRKRRHRQGQGAAGS